jgi:hypothetical protein
MKYGKEASGVSARTGQQGRVRCHDNQKGRKYQLLTITVVLSAFTPSSPFHVLHRHLVSF